MSNIDRGAMLIPSEELFEKLLERIDKKKQILDKRDLQFGPDRVKINSYMENIALPGLFDFDMNEYYKNPELALDINLRSKIFWLDNSNDDMLTTPDMAIASKYFDMTLFGIGIKHEKDGVPRYQPHELKVNADISLLKPFDFYKTGEMPSIHRNYEEIKKISRDWYGGKLNVGFPYFHRGPLDIYIQLRGYENFIEDTYNDPPFVRELFQYIVEERRRYNENAAALNNKTTDTTYIADDWVNVPFISPHFFEEFVIPSYLAIQKNEGKVAGFHTCGVFTPVIAALLDACPYIKTLDVGGWNDLELLDSIVAPDVAFSINMINTFVFFASEEEHRRKLKQALEISRHRKVSICAQSIVKVFDTFDESVNRMNTFIDMAREIFSERGSQS